MTGGWTSQPRVDPTKYESIQNPETKRWWIRPRNELTGLSDQEQGSIKQYDAGTASTKASIQSAYDEFAKWAQNNAAQGGAQLQGLSSLVGSGYNNADPTGAVLGTAAKQQQVGNVAPVIADLNRQPTLAKEAGLTNVTSWLAARGKERTDTISGYRQAAQEAATTARGQDLQHLDRVASTDASVTRANITADTRTADRASQTAKADADRASRERVEAAKLRERAAEADRKGREAESKRLAKAAAAREKAAKALAPKASDLRQWTRRATTLWAGVPTGQKDADGAPLRTWYTPAEIVKELVAMGASRTRAALIVDQISGANAATGRPASTGSTTYYAGVTRGGSPAGY
jgi:hypothetical protein